MHPSDAVGGIITPISFPNFASFRGIVICLAVVVGGVLYGYAFIPLKHLPGPWLSRIFPLQDWQGRRLRGKHLMHLHQRYGNSYLAPNLPFRFHNPNRSKSAFSTRNRSYPNNIRRVIQMDETFSGVKTGRIADRKPWLSPCHHQVPQ